jgi:ABC-type uncharacterized transport system permease subunit
LGLWWVLHRTRLGILIRAATSDREMVGALGVNQRWLFTGVFALGAFLAGLAGALQAPRVALTTVMDATVIAEAFVVVVIGGMGSAFGALFGAVLVGLFQAFGILVLPREFHLVLSFLVMAVVLVLRPRAFSEGPRRRFGPRSRSLDCLLPGQAGFRAGRGWASSSPSSRCRLCCRPSMCGCWWRSSPLRSWPGACSSWSEPGA